MKNRVVRGDAEPLAETEWPGSVLRILGTLFYAAPC